MQQELVLSLVFKMWLIGMAGALLAESRNKVESWVNCELTPIGCHGFESEEVIPDCWPSRVPENGG